jgi:hypothetical protein
MVSGARRELSACARSGSWKPSPEYVFLCEGGFESFANVLQAGAYEEKYLREAVSIFENMLSFGNHLRIFSEEISRSGEQLGNTPQAFSHLALISAAFNLDKTLSGKR